MNPPVIDTQTAVQNAYLAWFSWHQFDDEVEEMVRAIAIDAVKPVCDRIEVLQGCVDNFVKKQAHDHN